MKMKKIKFGKIGYICAILSLLIPMFGLIITAEAADSFGDPFDGNNLQNPNWKWQNEPPKWDVGKTVEGRLYIDCEPNRNLWAGDASHLLYQETDADMFEIETHFRAKWDTDSGVNGILVKSPKDNDWVTIKFWGRDAGAKGHIQYQGREKGLGHDDIQWRFGDWGDIEMSMRLKKDGDTYTAWYKAEGDDDWMDIGESTVVLTPPLWLGVYAGVAAGAGNLEVEYEYFTDNMNPFNVEAGGKATTTWGNVKTRY